MINQIGQIMLYVYNQDDALKFWTETLDFVVIAEESSHGIRWIEIAPNEDSQTSLVLHNKEVIAELSPEINLSTPSIMFFTDHLSRLHDKLKTKNIPVGDIIEMPMGKVLNFADNEENYFAVMEKD